MQTASTNICERMGRSQELSEFQRSIVIGCHLCNKSSREISERLNALLPMVARQAGERMRWMEEEDLRGRAGVAM